MHVGVFRSLGGFQPLQERKFGKLLFDNPSGHVISNFTTVPTYIPQFAYTPGGNEDHRNDVCDLQTKAKKKRCWFWAKEIKAYDHITIVFDVPFKMKAAFCEFGADKHEKDQLIHSQLSVASMPGPNEPFDSANPCGAFKPITTGNDERMLYWEQGASDIKTLPVPTVKCLRLSALQAQPTWAIVWQFLVRSQ